MIKDVRSVGADATRSLAELIRAAPRRASPKSSAQKIAELLEAAGPDSRLAESMKHAPVRDLLSGIADHSPYLWRLANSDPDRLGRLLGAPPWLCFEALLKKMNDACASAVDDDSVMTALRKAKQEAALAIALADIGGVWDLLDVTNALASFADQAVSCALSYLLRQAGISGRLLLDDPLDPQRNCGVVVLAMGKHGACELNYSSDIDLIVFYDPDSSALPTGANPGPLFVQVTQRLARLLEERTGDGYVLRVDLRLRPDPGSTSVAISLPAASNYYETLGQNWERAALIKARPVAGEIIIGQRFLNDLTPFIWRKYFDYAAIADIHAMKRQIHFVRGHAEVAIAGHDLKLGRGGIREIEFFVQTQQLIFGGRRPQLRGSRTLDMLVELQRDGWVTMEAVDDLSAAYRHLRKLEHRLQMVADEQTQRLPSDAAELTSFARFCGYASLKTFERDLMLHLRNVERHYARLFEHAPGLDASRGSLVFTGVADDPETLETLRGLGFSDPAAAVEIIRGWHFGRRSAVQSARAREVLTELVPALLESFSGSGDADAALTGFDAALTRMPAAVELLSILKSNAHIRDLFADILGSAPRLAQVVTQRPHVLDAAIDPAFVQSRGDETGYGSRVDSMLKFVSTTEDFLDAVRDIVQEETFLTGVRTLSDVISPVEAGMAYSALASVVVRATFGWVARSFKDEYGESPGGRCVVLALGKLGSREMTAASDLDLIMIYDFDESRPDSTGRKSLHGTQYFTRLTQRLISALTVATRRGRLYDVDMRLRPSGRKGPVATQWGSFRDYQRREAETWEHMALTRARVVAGDEILGAEVMRFIHEIIARPPDEEALQKDVREMRELIAREKGDSDPWDLKLAAGGVVDLEFVAQYLTLRWAHDCPEIIDTKTDAVFEKAGAFGLLGLSDCDRLRSAHRMFADFTQMARMTIDGPFNPATAPEGARRRINLALGLPDFRRVEQELRDTRAAVRGIFNTTMQADG